MSSVIHRLARIAVVLFAALPLQPAWAGCTLVHGHGRNHDPRDEAANRQWDALNRRFHQAVMERLAQAGWTLDGLWLGVAETDLQANAQRLLDQARERGCTRVLDGTVFAEPAQGLLILRLRLHPLLQAQGPLRPGLPPRIGEPIYQSRRELALEPRVLERLALGSGVEALAHAMAEELAAAQP
ncbi:hypothetical protein LZ017_04140 [Pelomonas sp. CA6]|uniref:hypothetical protein n=1 Tax=Pelomonas sp. CA6 TaxID=2907999 RepID=UPI001F4B979D|nr:hypothetical protein [Pelomonas sp. CA6]MCH7342567.1 hypothetical protein [Pelomonas sp. CA6]